MYEELTRDYLIEVRPSGVLKAMIKGLHVHSEMSDCALALDALGILYPKYLDDYLIYPPDPESKTIRQDVIGKYHITPSLACVTSLMGTTYPKWVDSVTVRPVIPVHSGYVLLHKDDKPLHDPPVLDSLHWAMYLVSRGSLQFLFDFFNFNLKHTYSKQVLFNIQCFPEFQLDIMRYSLNKEWVPQSLIISEIADILEQFEC